MQYKILCGETIAKGLESYLGFEPERLGISVFCFEGNMGENWLDQFTSYLLQERGKIDSCDLRNDIGHQFIFIRDAAIKNEERKQYMTDLATTFVEFRNASRRLSPQYELRNTDCYGIRMVSPNSRQYCDFLFITKDESKVMQYCIDLVKNDEEFTDWGIQLHEIDKLNCANIVVL